MFGFRLTNWLTVEANGNSGGFGGHAAGQTAWHGLNRVAFSILTVEFYFFLQGHRLKLQMTLCKRT